ncbi:hypothetical protein [Methyloceanibacter marginalis]|nr:hypothetical protein [Methyloceanibacter marginalis]
MGEKLQKLSAVLGEDAEDYYRTLISPWGHAWSLVKGAARPEPPASAKR